jgi:hypothetical protein
MTTKLRILVIEDDPKHLQDAKDFFSTIEIDVTYRESYEPFNYMTRINTPHLYDDFSKYDGVISDIYFPEFLGKETQPIGVSVMFQCKLMNIPCILCTAGHHHGLHYQWIHDMWVGLQNAGWKEIPRIIDSMYGKEHLQEEGEKGEQIVTKGWAIAWMALQKQLEEKSKTE